MSKKKNRDLSAFLFGFLGGILAVAITVIVIMVVYLVLPKKEAEKKTEIDIAKEMYLEGYGDKTVGEAFDSYFTDVSWKHYILDGKSFVEMSGKKLRNKKEIVDVKFVFAVNDVKLSVYTITAKGYELSSTYGTDKYQDREIIKDILDKIYE